MHWGWDAMLIGGLLPVGAVLALCWRAQEARVREVVRCFGAALWQQSGGEQGYRVRQQRLLLAGAVWVLLVLALADPQWGRVAETVEQRGMDVVLVVDCSASMNTPDFPPSRLQAARLEVGDAFKKLEGNRLGLVGFAGAAYIFCPLTLDTSAAELFLDQLDTQSIPVPGTALAEALRTGLGLFGKTVGRSRAMILISDGEDHHSEPLEAAREVAREGVVVHTIGIGSESGQKIPQTDASGRQDFVRDNDGNQVVSRLDAKTLQEVARLTGGTYTQAQPGKDMLASALAAIQGASKTALATTRQSHYQHQFTWFVLPALLLLFLERRLAVRA